MTLFNPGNAFGDYLLWRQILDFAKEMSKDVVFVSNDKKAWSTDYNSDSEEIPSTLSIEFTRETSQRILFLDSRGFYYLVNKELNLEISADIIDALSIPFNQAMEQFSDIDFSGVQEALNTAHHMQELIPEDIMKALQTFKLQSNPLEEYFRNNPEFLANLNILASHLSKTKDGLDE